MAVISAELLLVVVSSPATRRQMARDEAREVSLDCVEAALHGGPGDLQRDVLAFGSGGLEDDVLGRRRAPNEGEGEGGGDKTKHGISRWPGHVQRH
jgi:hypothetical protein